MILGLFNIVFEALSLITIYNYDLVKALDDNNEDIIVSKDNKKYIIHINDIYYIEVISNKIFIYTKNDCYERDDKLEEKLVHFGFKRCSKSMLVNI